MEKTEFIQHWSYFCSLAERLDDTKHYIDHGIQENSNSNVLIHANVYSDIFKQIIVLAASEFEVMSKALCACITGKNQKKMNIVEISSCILSNFPRIIEFEVSSPFWQNMPISEWKISSGKVKGLDWWTAYNSIKHGNKSAMKLATLENAILSLEALYIINLYLMFKLFGDMSIAFAYPTVYFKCKYIGYPVNSGEGCLPDYGNFSVVEKMQQKYPELFSK